MSTPATGTTGRQHVLAEGVRSTKLLLGRFLTGFNDVTHVRQTPDLPNHVAWNLGHLALTMHRVAAMLDGGPVPAKDFVSGDGFKGSRDTGMMDSEAVAFGSKPEDRHDRYPKLERCTETYNSACERLALAITNSPDAKLDDTARWGNGELPMHQLIIRMVFHNGFHTGQISDLRRALGFKMIMG